MKKIVSFSAVAAIIIFMAVAIYVYQLIRAPIVAGAERATAYVLNEKILETVSDVDFYHGKETYWIARGHDKQGQDLFIWLQQKDDQLSKVSTMPVQEGISKQEAKQVVTDEHGIKHADTVRLGYEDKQAVYEVTYSDQAGGKAFVYVTFRGGEVLKSYVLGPHENEE